jgi:thymidylate kinase
MIHGMDTTAMTHMTDTTETADTTDAVGTPPRVRALAPLRALFDRLNQSGIRYCHWKSNEHLDPSFTGATDVDALFDRAAIGPLTQLLVELGFKRFVVKPGRGYPGIEDYVGFDEATGTLTHLHVHYQLTLGEKFLKGHRLPWEERYLATRVFDDAHGLYVADPRLELIVLVVRQAMKLRLRDRAAALAGREFFRGGMQREFRWLVERVDPDAVRSLATELVGERAAALFPAMIAAGRPSTAQLRRLRRLADPAFREYRLYDASGAALRGWARETGHVLFRLAKVFQGAPPRSTRTLPQGGVTIAVLGADGAGKSTLVGELTRWLSREVAVATTYGGSGVGSASLPRLLMQRLARVRRVVRGGASGGPGAPRTERAAPVSAQPLTTARGVWVLSLARERVRRALDARRARSHGMVVLSDRIPQSQFPGMNDGPRLATWLDSPSRLRRWAARREREAFRLSELVPPDLVIKLHVPPEIALRRKPETPSAQVERGAQLLRDLRWPATTRVVDLDATLPLDQVIVRAKRAVWAAL